MKVAVIQMVSGPHLQANLQAAERALGEAADQGAELAVLPEYFCMLGHSDRDKLAIAEQPGHGPIQDRLRHLALQHSIWIAGGTLPLATADPNRARNSALVFNPTGEQVARYDKLHLFRFSQGGESYDESRTLERGNEVVRFELPSRDGHVWKVGLSVCYDLRFPELYRQLQCDLLLAPSAFTHTTGQEHWEVLLRARAIENLAYVAAAAQGGLHDNGRRTWGHSMLVDPWGQVLGECPEGAGLVVAELQARRLAAVRAQLPALGHRVLP
jgi:nitrilase